MGKWNVRWQVATHSVLHNYIRKAISFDNTRSLGELRLPFDFELCASAKSLLQGLLAISYSIAIRLNLHD